MKKIVIISIIFSSLSLSASSVIGQQLFDINFRSHIQRVKKHELLVIPSFGFSGQGRDGNGNKVNPLQYLQSTQDALAMLKGFPVGSIEDQIAQQINIDDDNGVRGHFKVTGNYSFEYAIFSYSYHIFDEWFFRIRTPFVGAKISNTSWVDLTQNITLDDQLTRELLTDNLISNVQQFGDLRLCDWSARGMGDTLMYLHWERVFLQEKEWLKEVAVNARCGVSIPTGKKKNEDMAFSFAFGNDGAWGLPFGAGLDLKFKKFLRAGVDIAFESIFNHTKDRRIVTDPAQTDFLLLQKAPSRKEYGITQMFNLYLEPQLTEKMTCRLAYMHTKHGSDKLYILGNSYSYTIANKAASLKEWTNHSAFFQIRYDNQGTLGLISPIISGFIQVPFNGKRSLNATSIGFDVAVHF